MGTDDKIVNPGWQSKKWIYLILHIGVLVLSLFLILHISIDTFRSVSFYNEIRFMHIQFWICLGFMADFFIELFMSTNKWKYLKSHFIFFLVAIPYQALIFKYDLKLPEEVTYLLRYMPLIRSGYLLAIVVGWLTYSKASGLFFTYLIILISTVYFASLTFYLFEHGQNELVHTYKDALWWACMDVTTVGSNIVAVTGMGRVLSVVLAAMGMMMFPIFTVYITNIVTKKNDTGVAGILAIPKRKKDMADSQVKS